MIVSRWKVEDKLKFLLAIRCLTACRDNPDTRLHPSSHDSGIPPCVQTSRGGDSLAVEVTSATEHGLCQPSGPENTCSRIKRNMWSDGETGTKLRSRY